MHGGTPDVGTATVVRQGMDSPARLIGNYGSLDGAPPLFAASDRSAYGPLASLRRSCDVSNEKLVTIQEEGQRKHTFKLGGRIGGWFAQGAETGTFPRPGRSDPGQALQEA